MNEIMNQIKLAQNKMHWLIDYKYGLWFKFDKSPNRNAKICYSQISSKTDNVSKV